MKPQIIRSRTAKEDLAQIWSFIAKDSEYYAERFIRFVDERLIHLAAHPLIGRPRSELAPGLRSFLIRHLIVFYRPVAEGIEIARVLHASRDIEPAMFESLLRLHDAHRSGSIGNVVLFPRLKADEWLFLEILNQMAQGNAVTLVPTHHELTTQQAADLLRVSRPYFVKLLETGAIQHHRVGTRRRVKFEHLMAYMENVKGESRDALAQLAAQAQELGMGY